MSLSYQKELPVFRKVDVVVAGAGPAGIGAAVAAARNGAKPLFLRPMDASAAWALPVWSALS